MPIRSRLDADQARREARRLAISLGFDRGDAETVALAASELAMNLHRYAVEGEIVLRAVQDGARRGLEIESQDAGPGSPILSWRSRTATPPVAGLAQGCRLPAD